MSLASRILFPIIALILTACPSGTDDDYEFEYQTIVTDIPVNLAGINSEHDDYNSDLPYPYVGYNIFFSSSRPSGGQHFDITTRWLDISYHEKDDVLDVHYGPIDNISLYEEKLLTLINSSHDQLGPHSLWGPKEYGYFFYSDDLGGDFDIRYTYRLESDEPATIEFSGIGLVIKGGLMTLERRSMFDWDTADPYVGEFEVSIDGEVDRVVKLPADYRKRTAELYWNVEIPDGEHTATLKWLNPVEGKKIGVRGYIEYGTTRQEIEVVNK